MSQKTADQDALEFPGSIDDGQENHPARMLERESYRADEGVELARQFTHDLPRGDERDKAEVALKEMSRIADRLNGRDAIREEIRNESEEDRRERTSGEYRIEVSAYRAEMEYSAIPPGDDYYKEAKEKFERLENLSRRNERFEPVENYDKRMALTITPDSERNRTERETPEPEREMKTSSPEKNIVPERAEVGPGHDPVVEPEKDTPAPGSNKERMQQIRERDAAHLLERDRNPDADRDR